MKLIQLGGHQREIKGYAMVDDEDFKRLSVYNWSLSSNGYAFRDKNKKRLLLHREIMKNPVNRAIDHINRNKLDNQKINLRICSQSENSANCGIQKNNTSGFKGVYWHNSLKYWVAEIKKNRKRINLGYFKDKKSAALAYNTKAKELFGEFAYLNQI